MYFEIRLTPIMVGQLQPDPVRDGPGGEGRPGMDKVMQLAD